MISHRAGDVAYPFLPSVPLGVDPSHRQEFPDLFEATFFRFEPRLAQQTAELRSDLSRLETRLIRWMFGFWVGAWIAIAGTVVAQQRLL